MKVKVSRKLQELEKKESTTIQRLQERYQTSEPMDFSGSKLYSLDI